ncbi:MAG: hypothetical protein RLZZ592_1608 [Pseudomonadota bacterium]|jgi:signal transduction histidine kinase/CheY-like chemotaxis protein
MPARRVSWDEERAARLQRWRRFARLLLAATWGGVTAVLLPQVDALHRLALLMPVAFLCLGSPTTPFGLAWLQAALAGLPALAGVMWLRPFEPLLALLATILLLGSTLAGLHHRRTFLVQQVLRDRAALLAAQLAQEKEVAEEARAAAEAATRARTSFFAAASHDLRQPLHALVLFTESLRLRNRDAGLNETIGRMAGAVDALEHLFDRLLDLSSLDAGAVQVDERAFRLREVYARLKLHFEPQAFDKGLSLSFRGGRHAALADPVLVERILRNLVSNAIRFTEDGGVLVSCRARDGTLLLQVWDSGRGIPAEMQSRIFDEYCQIGPPDTDEPAPRRGRGLGLAIVRKLADLMGLPLQVQSRPGRGTVFTLRLRQASAAQIEEAGRLPAAPVWSSPTLQGRHVVCIGEQAAAEAGAAGLLRGWGARVTGLASGAGLAGWVAGQPAAPDLLIVDGRLADGRGGLIAVRTLRQLFGHPVPAVLLQAPGEMLPEPPESDVHALTCPVAPNRLRAMVGSKLAPRLVQSRTPTRS